MEAVSVDHRTSASIRFDRIGRPRLRAIAGVIRPWEQFGNLTARRGGSERMPVDNNGPGQGQFIKSSRGARDPSHG